MSTLLMLLLFVFTLCLMFVLGSFCLAGFDALLKPKWTAQVASSTAAISGAVLPLWILFAVVLVLRNSIFPWIMHPHHDGSFQAHYLEPGMFLVRGLIYLILATGFSWMIRTQRKIYGALSLILLLFFGSLASYDWVMSVFPEFHSTIFGLLVLTNGTLMAYALALTRMPSPPEPKLLNDLNNVHLAMIALWSYLAFMQYLSVWSANLPGEASYYQDRFHHLSGTLAAFLLVGQTLIPIPLLLFKKLKGSFEFTKNLAYWTLFMQCLHVFWMIGGTT